MEIQGCGTVACTAKEIFCIDAWTFIYKVLLMFKGWLTENDKKLFTSCFYIPVGYIIISFWQETHFRCWAELLFPNIQMDADLKTTSEDVNKAGPEELPA